MTPLMPPVKSLGTSQAGNAFALPDDALGLVDVEDTSCASICHQSGNVKSQSRPRRCCVALPCFCHYAESVHGLADSILTILQATTIES